MSSYIPVWEGEMSTEGDLEKGERSFWEKARETGDRIWILFWVSLAIFMATTVWWSIDVLGQYTRNDMVFFLLLLGMMLEALSCLGSIVYLLHLKEEIDEMD